MDMKILVPIFFLFETLNLLCVCVCVCVLGDS